MSLTVKLVLSCTGLVILIVIGVILERRKKHRSSLPVRLGKVPITSIANLPPSGLVHVVGTVQAPKEQLVAAPFSNRLVVYSDSFMLYPGPRYEHGLVRGTQFELTDGNGSITIDPQQTEYPVEPERVELVTDGKSKVFGAGVMSRHNEDLEVQYAETVISVGDRIHVIGTLREENGQRILAAAAAGPPLLIVPESADGRR